MYAYKDAYTENIHLCLYFFFYPNYMKIWTFPDAFRISIEVLVGLNGLMIGRTLS